MKIVKSLLLSLFCSLYFCAVAQENVLQIAPVSLSPGIKRAAIELQMNNTDSYLAMQFDIYFPEGMTLSDGNKPFGSLSKKRFPYTEDYDEDEDVTTYTFEHAVEFRRKEGFCRFVISPNTISYIKGNNGTLVKLYVQTSENMKPGIYPVKLKGVVFTKYDGKKTYSIRPPELTSYIVVGEPDYGRLLDLSSWSGYVPADIVGGLSSVLAEHRQIAAVCLDGIEDAGKALETKNPNTVIYLKNSASVVSLQKAVSAVNVVDGTTCDELVLKDDNSVCIPKPFVAVKAVYERLLADKGWYSLCLPFDADTPDGISVERFSSVNTVANTVVFKPGIIESNRPCIFNSQVKEVSFSANDVKVETTETIAKDEAFEGTYEGKKAGEIENCYALYPDGRGFGKAGSTATVAPFRAYISQSQLKKSNLKLIHEGETTSVIVYDGSRSLEVTANSGQMVLESKDWYGQVRVFRIDGSLAGAVNIEPGEQKVLYLPKGTYLINDKKYIIQ